MVSVDAETAPTQAIPFNTIKEAGIIAWLLHRLMEVILLTFT